MLSVPPHSGSKPAISRLLTETTIDLSGRAYFPDRGQRIMSSDGRTSPETIAAVPSINTGTASK